MKAPDFWTTGRGPWPTVLAPLGCLHALAARARRTLTRPHRAPVPVVCVGNLTAGGTGKTPVALTVARRLAAAGAAVHVLTRGYGGALGGPVRVDPARHGAAQVGDEALLLARTAPTWVAHDRVAGAAAAAAAAAQVIVMDDGFQNPSLVKDVALVVIDGETGFGNGRVIPAGPLREPVADGLARADAAVIVGEDGAGAGAAIARLRPALPALACRLVPAAATLAGARVFGFAGIGRPEKFRATLAEIGCDVAGFRPFPDHHPYTAAEIAAVTAEAEHLGARPVTTAKDHVRLSAAARANIEVVEVEATFADAAALDRVLAAAIRPAAPGP